MHNNHSIINIHVYYQISSLIILDYYIIDYIIFFQK